jgi:hypothetical protein
LQDRVAARLRDCISAEFGVHDRISAGECMIAFLLNFKFDLLVQNSSALVQKSFSSWGCVCATPDEVHTRERSFSTFLFFNCNSFQIF